MPYLYLLVRFILSFFFFFNDTATTEIYTLSLHDVLPILSRDGRLARELVERIDVQVLLAGCRSGEQQRPAVRAEALDRKSTRLNSSHGYISYAVFCLKKKKINKKQSKTTQKEITETLNEV